MLLKNFNYNIKQISDIAVDNQNGEFLWIAFKSDGSKCVLKKVSAHNPLQVYFEVDINVQEIKKIFLLGTFVYIAVDNTNFIGMRLSRSNPFSGRLNFSIPSGITEAPIDLIVYSTRIFILVPGEGSGKNTKIVVMTLTGGYLQTIDLVTVNNAVSFTRDAATGDLWVGTYASPATYVRVYDTGGENYNYTVNY